MKFFDRKNFHEACSFNCRLTRHFGYFYFPLEDDSRKLKVCRKILFIRISLYVIVGLLVSIKSSEVNIGNSTNSIIINMGMKIIIQQTLFMPTIFRVMNFLLRHQHATIVANIQSIDDDFKALGFEIDYRKHFAVAFTLTVAYFGFLLLTFYVDDELTSKFLEIRNMDPLGALLGAVNVTAYLSYLISHMLVTYAIYKRFQLVNRALRRRNLDYSLVKKIANIHIRLCDTVDLLNFCFSLNLLNYFCQFVIFSIFYFFGLYHFMTTPVKTVAELIFNVVTSFYWAYYFWFGAWMVTVGSWIESEGKEIKREVHSKIPKNAKAAKACNNFCLQMDQNNPVVSCGLFAVGWAFVFAFIGTLFSYLIILIQFESG